MKKKVFGAVALIAIAVAAGWNVQQSNNKVEMSDLTLENIEALASGEGSGDCDVYCRTDPNYMCLLSWGGDIEGISCPGYRRK